VDEAYGDFGHTWRATYIKSNSAQDLVVTSLPGVSREVQRAIRHATAQEVIGALTWLIGLLAGLAAWVTSWRVIMPRRLGVPTAGARGGCTATPSRGSLVPNHQSGRAAACRLGALPGQRAVRASPLADGRPRPARDTCCPGAGQCLLLRALEGRETAGHARAGVGAYMLVVLMANALYLAFAAGYSAIVGAI